MDTSCVFSKFVGLLVAVLLGHWQVASAQSENLAFSRLTTVQGLPERVVHAFEMDDKGFAWLGMEDGLFRWDGHHLRRYQPLRDDTTSLPCAFVQTLLKDPDGSIWVGTIGGGICNFNPTTGRFRRLPCLPNQPGALSDPNAWKFFLDSKNDLWIGVFNAGLNRFNRQTNTFEHFPLVQNLKNEQEAYQHNTVRDLVEDIEDPGVLWLAANDGIVRFEKATGAVTHFYSQAPKSGGMACNAVFMDRPGELWVGTYGNGLVRFDTRTFQWQYFTPKPAAWAKRSTTDNIILDIFPKSETEYWVCSPDMGFGIFNRQTGRVFFFKNDPENPLSILANTANEVFQDPQKRLWIAHVNKGISILDPEQPPFSFCHLPQGDCPFFDNEQITGFDFDPIRRCYFVTGSACDGLFMLDEQKHFLKKIPATGNEGGFTIYQTVKTDRQGVVWVGGISRPGNNQSNANYPLYVLSPGAEKLRPFVHRSLPKTPFNVLDIYEDRIGNIWFATDYLGVIQFDRARDTMIVYVQSATCPSAPSQYVHCRQILEDQKGRIWVATQGEGVFCLNPATNAFRQWLHLKTGLNGLVETRVNSIAEDEKGRIWLATSGNGIQWLDPENEQQPIVAQLAAPEGLPSPRINRIVRDRNGRMWVTTEGGICRYNSATGQFEVFGQQDGVLRNGFYEQGLATFPTGEVMVGQNTGFYLFESRLENLKVKPAALVFSGFKVFEKEMVFEKDLNYLPEIRLPHDQNYFTIAFSELSYARSKAAPLAYRLEGYDADWIYPANDRRLATYTRVPPGEYTFQVRASNMDPKTQEIATISLKINILYPWWRSWWAYSIYIVFTLAAMYNFYNIRFQRHLARQETHRLQELDRFKTRFFANISHEFRTPLTMLIGPAENALNRWPEMKTDDLRGILHTVRRNGYRLLNLVNQLLDLSRLEAGKLRLAPVNGDLVTFLRYQVESCHSYAETRHIQVHFESNLPELPMAFDPEKIQVIVVNLLSNALKFTPDGGKVQVTLKLEEGALPNAPCAIVVTDTGHGIPARELGKIFDRFYQVDNSMTRPGEGTGIGLAMVQELVKLMQGTVTVESTVGVGTTFRVTLPHTPPQPQWQTFHPASAESKIPMASLLATLPSPTPEIAAENPSFSPAIANASSASLPRVKAEAGIVHRSSFPHLLIIEDNPDVVDYLKTCLESAYQLEVAYNGKTGIEKALETIPDLIISDVMMPEKNGYEVCDTLKNDERTSHIPIVLLTAKADIASKIAGLRRGADAYLPKPFHQEELLVQLEMLLERQKRMVAHFSKKTESEPLVATPEQQEAYEVENAFMQKVRQIIEEHLPDENFALPGLCEQLNMSRSQLFRKMKALADVSPSDLIRTHRLQKAKSLLETGGLTVSEVAWRVGYKEVSHFSKSFQDMYGVSPSAVGKI